MLRENSGMLPNLPGNSSRMMALTTTARFDRGVLLRLADWLAAAVAMALPWSTTATGVCIAAWLIVVLPTLDMASVRREIGTAAGGLPVLLWCLGVVGMLWADVGWSERLGSLGGFNRLLLIPLLLAHFRHSEHGRWVVYGFLASSASVLLVSYFLLLTPGLTWRSDAPGVPVHDDIFQGSIFLICGFGALGCVLLDQKRSRRVAWTLCGLGVLFLANFAFVIFSRAALLVAPVVAILLGWRALRWKGFLAAVGLGSVVAIVAWSASPGVRSRVDNSLQEINGYRSANTGTPIGEHIAFLKESLVIIALAPVIGHGTGSIPQEFRRITAGETGVSAEVTENPHNQTFAVAIQLGLIGAVVLWAMWIAHLMLFRGRGLTAWIGSLVVVENIVSSIVHSHLFDFNHGWLYVFGVGVLGGMALRQHDELYVK